MKGWRRPLFAGLILALSAAALVLAQSSRDTVHIELQGVSLSVEYGRPSLNGRDMLSKAPVGTTWRLGADEATTLEVTGSLVFGNMVASPGSYSLFLKRVSEDEWSLIVNKETGQWGTEHDPAQDLLGVPMKWDKQDASTEVLTIDLEPETPETGILSIRWGRDRLRQRFRLVPAAS